MRPRDVRDSEPGTGEQHDADFETLFGGGILSTVNVSGQGRALPFTGLAALPLLLIGGFLSIVGGLAALVGPKRKATKPTG